MSRVLKERRIFWDRRFAWGLCGVPSERTDFTTCSQGFTLGWYAMPRWGRGPTTTPDAGDAPLGYGADNDTGCRRCLVRHGTTIKSVMEMGFWVPQQGMEPMTNISQAMPRPNMEPTATPMEAMPRWGMGPTTTPDADDAPLRHGTTIESAMRMGFWVPQGGTAYQPRVKPWEPKTPCLAF